MNVVRKHLDRVKGGGLARLASAGARPDAGAERRGRQPAGRDRFGADGA